MEEASEHSGPGQSLEPGVRAQMTNDSPCLLPEGLKRADMTD